MRIFLDANILFAAALPKSRTSVFLAKFQKHAVLITNMYAIEEARRNLSNKKTVALPHLESLLKWIEVVGVTTTALDVKIASKDIPILGGAIAGNATHLLTGDKQDFEALWGKTFQGVKIVSPQMLADELAKKGWLKQIRKI